MSLLRQVVSAYGRAVLGQASRRLSTSACLQLCIPFHRVWRPYRSCPHVVRFLRFSGSVAGAKCLKLSSEVGFLEIGGGRQGAPGLINTG